MRRAAQQQQRKTERLLVTLTPEVKRRLIAEAQRLYGRRKGYISMYLESVLRNHFRMEMEGVEEA